MINGCSILVLIDVFVNKGDRKYASHQERTLISSVKAFKNSDDSQSSGVPFHSVWMLLLNEPEVPKMLKNNATETSRE